MGLACAGWFAAVLPAAAFSQPGCFLPPSTRHSIPSLITEISAGIYSVRAAEKRACYYYARGLLYHLEADYAHAIMDYTTALGWIEDYGDVYAARADAYAAMGQTDNAAKDYALAARYSDDSAAEFAQRCLVRGLRGSPLAPALQDCNAALARDPEDSNAREGRCLVYFRMGNYRAAIADCDIAEAAKRENASTLYIRGLAKLRSGDTQGGNADLAAANAGTSQIANTFAIFGIKP